MKVSLLQLKVAVACEVLPIQLEPVRIPAHVLHSTCSRALKHKVQTMRMRWTASAQTVTSLHRRCHRLQTQCCAHEMQQLLSRNLCAASGRGLLGAAGPYGRFIADVTVTAAAVLTQIQMASTGQVQQPCTVLQLQATESRSVCSWRLERK
jgi:hypothetical protein